MLQKFTSTVIVKIKSTLSKQYSIVLSFQIVTH